jgi:hypothetical protein
LAINAINPFIGTLGTFIFSHFYFLTWHWYTIGVGFVVELGVVPPDLLP